MEAVKTVVGETAAAVMEEVVAEISKKQSRPRRGISGDAHRVYGESTCKWK